MVQGLAKHEKELGGSMTSRKMRWVGPLTIESLLDECLVKPVWPPESGGVYLVSRGNWNVRPNEECFPLYVGSNTGKAPRFRTRVGDLVADMFGFFGSTGHSSGGRSLHAYCCEEQVNPKRLYIGWADNCSCLRCAENYIYDWLDPKLNKNRPPRCQNHRGGQRYRAAITRLRL